MRVFQMIMAVLFWRRTDVLPVGCRAARTGAGYIHARFDGRNGPANLRSASPRRKARIARGCMPKTRMTET